MKTYKNHIRYLKILNLFSIAVIVATIAYTWVTMQAKPESIRVYGGESNGTGSQVGHQVVWEDVSLMVALFMLCFLITIYAELTPFRCSSGFHRAQIISIINLCITLVFAFTIIGGLG